MDMKKLFIYYLLCWSCISAMATSCSQNDVTKSPRVEKTKSPRVKDTTVTSGDTVSHKGTSQTLTPEEEAIVKHLRDKGASKQEIDLMVAISRETYTANPGTITFGPGHFFYSDSAGNSYDNGQTNQNCGLYAIKRFMHHLGMNGIINKDLWWKYSDKELRYIIAERLCRYPDGDGNNFFWHARSESQTLTNQQLANLMCWLGIPNRLNPCIREGEDIYFTHFDKSPLPPNI